MEKKDTGQTAALLAEQQHFRAARNRQLTPEQLHALAREVLRLMRSDLRGELERRGQENGRPVIRR